MSTLKPAWMLSLQPLWANLTFMSPKMCWELHKAQTCDLWLSFAAYQTLPGCDCGAGKSTVCGRCHTSHRDLFHSEVYPEPHWQLYSPKRKTKLLIHSKCHHKATASSKICLWKVVKWPNKTKKSSVMMTNNYGHCQNKLKEFNKKK